MQTVQHTKHFSHPSNWAGYFLIGSDVRLSSKVALMGQALCELLKTPDRCRDALRVTLHLVRIICIMNNNYVIKNRNYILSILLMYSGRKIITTHSSRTEKCYVYYSKKYRK